MTDREIMQQALDALNSPNFGVYSRAILALQERLAHCDRCGKRLGGEGDIHTCTPDPIGDAQDSLIAELAAQPKEPVAWVSAVTGDVTTQDMSHTVSWVPLTTPPAAAPVQLVAGLEQCEFDDECEFCKSPQGGSFTRLIHNAEDCTEAEFYICGDCVHEALRRYTAPPAAAQPAAVPLTDEDAAFKDYLKDCDEHAINPDVGSAFHFAFQAAPPAAAQRKPLTNEQKQSMWIAATIDPCSHIACYLRGIADTETAHGIKEKNNG